MVKEENGCVSSNARKSTVSYSFNLQLSDTQLHEHTASLIEPSLPHSMQSTIIN